MQGAWEIVQDQFPKDSLVLYNEREGVFRKVSARLENGNDQSWSREEIDFADRKFEEVKRDFEVGSALYKIMPEHFPRYISMKVDRECGGILNMLRPRKDLDGVRECITVVTEKVEGMTFMSWLFERLDDDSLILKDYLRLMITIFGIHLKLEPDFTHFDLHLKNILVDEGNDRTKGEGVHLLDFGASFYQSSTGQVLGQNIPEFGRVPRYFWMHDAVNFLMSTFQFIDQSKLLDFFEPAIPNLIAEAFPDVPNHSGIRDDMVQREYEAVIRGLSRSKRDLIRDQNEWNERIRGQQEQDSEYVQSKSWDLLDRYMRAISSIPGPRIHLLNYLWDIQKDRDTLYNDRPRERKLYFSIPGDDHQVEVVDFILEALKFMQVDPHDFTWQYTLLRPLEKYMDQPIEPFYRFLVEKMNEL